MHVLLMLMALAALVVFFVMRAQRRSTAADQVVDAAAHLKGAVTRRRRVMASEQSPIRAIDDPLVAAATLVHLVAGPDGWPKVHRTVRADLAALGGAAKADEAITYAEWAARQGLDEDKAVEDLAGALAGWLSDAERVDLSDMVAAVAGAGEESPRMTARVTARLARG